jgi:hypothetical protein
LVSARASGSARGPVVMMPIFEDDGVEEERLEA